MSTQYVSLPFPYIRGQEWMNKQYLLSPLSYPSLPLRMNECTVCITPFISIPAAWNEWVQSIYHSLSYTSLVRNEWVQSIFHPLSYPSLGLIKNEWIHSIYYHPFHIHPFSGMNEYRVFITPFISIPGQEWMNTEYL